MSMLNRRLTLSIKETMIGLCNAMRALGTILVTGFGGYLSKWLTVNAPFMMVGFIDLTFVAILIGLYHIKGLKPY